MEKPFYSDSDGESGPTESADSGNHGDNNILSIMNKASLPSLFSVQMSKHFCLEQEKISAEVQEQKNPYSVFIIFFMHKLDSKYTF